MHVISYSVENLYRLFYLYLICIHSANVVQLFMTIILNVVTYREIWSYWILFYQCMFIDI